MSKELQALERAKREHSALNCGFPDVEYLTQIDEIEKKLKELEELENRCSKAGITIDDYFKYLIEETIDNYKKLKALEIIKDKNVDVAWLCGCEKLEDYNKLYQVPNLTKEEYDLLKEVLL